RALRRTIELEPAPTDPRLRVTAHVQWSPYVSQVRREMGQSPAECIRSQQLIVGRMPRTDPSEAFLTLRQFAECHPRMRTDATQHARRCALLVLNMVQQVQGQHDIAAF